MMDSKTVAIVGAGVSGLASVKSCIEEGLTPTCFEQNEGIGGLWNYSDSLKPNQGSRIYGNLASNTSKELTCFSDFPHKPKETPYLSSKRMYKYLQRYAKKHNIEKYIEFKTRLVGYKKADDHDTSGKWDVETIRSERKAKICTFDCLMICTGIRRGPYIPKIEGLENFKGTTSHSINFTTGSPFTQKKVLVIGNSHSAGDIACEVSRHAAETYLSVGDGCVVHHHLDNGGVPVDMIASRFTMADSQRWLINRIILAKANAHMNHVTYGLQPSSVTPNTAKMLNSEIGFKIANGAIKVVAKVTRVDQLSVVKLVSGKELKDVDCIVFCTGFKYNDDILEMCRKTASEEDDGLLLYKRVFPAGAVHHTLVNIGGIATVSGSDLPSSELQARLATRVFSGHHELPHKEDMLEDIRQMNSMLRIKRGTNVPRALNIPYCDFVADEIGAKPCFRSLLSRNPRLAFQFLFGGAYPYHYRLQGPHAWSGAEQACLTAYDNIFAGLGRREKGYTTYFVTAFGVLSLIILTVASFLGYVI